MARIEQLATRTPTAGRRAAHRVPVVAAPRPAADGLAAAVGCDPDGTLIEITT